MAAAPRTSNSPITQATIRVLIILVVPPGILSLFAMVPGTAAMSGFTTNTREVQLKPITPRTCCGGLVHQSGGPLGQIRPVVASSGAWPGKRATHSQGPHARGYLPIIVDNTSF